MWSRNAEATSIPPIETWPTVHIDHEDLKLTEIFNSRKKAVTMYFSFAPLAEIQKTTGIRPANVVTMAKKCLLPASDGNILGLRALIPHMRHAPYTRTASTKTTRPRMKAGLTGALQQILSTHPEIENDLVAYIKKDAKTHRIQEFKLRPKDLHRIFIRCLKEKNFPQDEWPFNTKLLGIRSIEKYMKIVIEKNFNKTVNTRGTQEAIAHLATGGGHNTFIYFDEPYAAVEIDAYQIESHLTVAIKTPDGTETDLLLDRLWLIAVVDQFSSAILAYSVVYRPEVNASDVIGVIRQALVKRWEPMNLTIPGLRYEPNTGLPSGVIPEAYGQAWTSMFFDGALAHLSKAVHERARRAIGCVINWGPVGHFERRPNVERTFNQIAKDLFKRLPSTTGSNPLNGRANNAEEKAVRFQIRADEIEQLLDVSIAQHNALPSEGNSYLSPIEVIRYFFEKSNGKFISRKLPAQSHEFAKTLSTTEIVTIRGDKKNGRRPYIQIDRVHYTNPILANSGHLISKKIKVEIDEDDMRHVRAYFSNGSELGILKAHGKWSLTKHTRNTRKLINSLISNRILKLTQFDDPVQTYLKYISQGRDKKKGKLTPKQVTKMVQISKESNKELNFSVTAAEVPQTCELPTPLPESSIPSRFPNSNNAFKKVKNHR